MAGEVEEEAEGGGEEVELTMQIMEEEDKRKKQKTLMIHGLNRLKGMRMLRAKIHGVSRVNR